MSRRCFVAGNWKMNGSVALASEVRALVAALGGTVEVAIAPPFTALQAVARVLEGSGVSLAGQNCHAEKAGAFTGEISAPMLAEVGCAWVILGHSERRQLFGETDAGVNRKVGAVLAAGLKPIICVGETLAERQAGRTLTVVETQVKGCLAGFTPAQAEAFVLAYEPVWAIGTGQTATAAQAQEVHAHVRALLTGLFGAATSQQVRVQYGGSVKADNAAELLGQPDIDGALVGGASLKAAEFAAIVRAGG